MRESEQRPHASLCGAKTRTGIPCKNRSMPNGRCRMHGGKSTGPKTHEGIDRIRAARWKDGRYCREAREERHLFRTALNQCRDTLKKIKEEV